MEPSMKRVRVFDKKKVMLEKELGSGSFGRVCRATIADSKLPPVAVKQFYPQLQTSQLLRKAYEELNRVGALEHENVVTLIGMVDDDIPWLVFEYMRGGSLLDYVTTMKNISERRLVSYCRDIARGMAYLHRHRILHKDLAARNILLDDKMAKIADLGLSSILEDDQHTLNYSVIGKVLAYRHAASECIVEGIYTFGSDVWSMGILMWEIWTAGDTPYGQDLKEADVRRIVAEGGNPMHTKLPTCSGNMISLMEYILQVQKEYRPTFHELRMIFEQILEGGKFYRGLRSQLSNPICPTVIAPDWDHSADFVKSNKSQRHNLQNAMFSSTPNLLISSVSSTQGRKKSVLKTNSKDFLEPPRDYQAPRRGSNFDNFVGDDEDYMPGGTSELSSSLKNESFFPQAQIVSRNKITPFSSSANNLNQRLGKSQSDLHDEFKRDLIQFQTRFQRKK